MLFPGKFLFTFLDWLDYYQSDSIDLKAAFSYSSIRFCETMVKWMHVCAHQGISKRLA